jgi:predicted esterase
MRRTAAAWVLAAWLVTGTAAAEGIEQKAPSPKDGGKLFAWKAADGLVYAWRGPERYDAEKGVNLTLILHGSNLTHQWGFANHAFKSFRPDDLVVSPDGTTSNGNGGFNFLKEPKDGNRLHALIEELKKVFKVRATFLYGHSQGSFFALQYAGQHPQDVNGIVAHASGLWTWTNIGKHGHHIPIVFMHGTQDPVVPYGQSVGGYDALREAAYPTVRLRSLEFWNHWPAEHNGSVPHTSQQLAWVEGMSTQDPDRLRACFERLLPGSSKDERGEHDYAALHALAQRIAGLEAAPADLKERAAKAVAKVEALAEAHAAALTVKPGTAFDGKPWIGHLPVFLRAFPGVPARETLAAAWKDTLAEHQKQAVARLRKYFPALQKGKQAEAFEEGVAAIQAGFLWHECADGELRKNLKEWHKDAKKLKVGKPALKAYDAVMPAFDECISEGWKDFADVNQKHGAVE